jgi:hypothetical protein
MSGGWCPRCDALRASGDDCQECGTPLVSVERPARERSEPAESVAEVNAVTEGSPRARLRVALAVAAVVLIGLAFVAGRGTGHGTRRAATAVTSAPTATTGAAAEAAPAAHRALGWRSRAAGGITVTALTLDRIAGGDPNGDELGLLTIRVQGLPAGRQLLGLLGLELLDVGGGVFAGPEERGIGGVRAAQVRPAGQEGIYTVNLGPTPGVDTLARIRLDGVLLSQPPGTRSRIDLDTTGPWPAAAPLRAVEPAVDTLTVDLSSLNLPARGPRDAQLRSLPLQVAGAFVGARRAVVALRLGNLPNTPASDAPQAVTRQVGSFPVSVRLVSGSRTLCERTSIFGEGRPDSAPMVVVDCSTAPVTQLAVELGAGIQTVPFLASLPA